VSKFELSKGIVNTSQHEEQVKGGRRCNAGSWAREGENRRSYIKKKSLVQGTGKGSGMTMTMDGGASIGNEEVREKGVKCW